MNRILFLIISTAAIATLFMAFKPNHHRVILPIDDTPVADVLKKLGVENESNLVRSDVQGVSAEAGKQIILEGFSDCTDEGKTRRQSKHFLCTSCHNVAKEDPSLKVSDPTARLDYAIENGLPFLPGTTLYGIVNRNTFYNGDYEKKYGDLVKPARNSLRGAIELCAIECSQGRALEDWEMESIVAYLWTIGLKMSDLNIAMADMKSIQAALDGKGDKMAAAKLLQSYFLDHSPATFVTPPPNRDEGYGLVGDAENGKRVYESSCLHCHGEQRYSFFNLDTTDESLDYLAKHFNRYTRYSTYQVVRYGTSPMNGKKAYMPHYTQERMSNQQLEDLKAYIMQVNE